MTNDAKRLLSNFTTLDTKYIHYMCYCIYRKLGTKFQTQFTG